MLKLPIEPKIGDYVQVYNHVYQWVESVKDNRRQCVNCALEKNATGDCGFLDAFACITKDCKPIILKLVK